MELLESRTAKAAPAGFATDSSRDASASEAGVLVVDDRFDKRQAIQAVLSDLEYPVVLAGSGLEALSHLLRQDFAVILMDLNMPDMDGIEVAELIRARRRSAKTPIIFYTAEGTADGKRQSEAYRLGAVDFLFAPVPAEVLRSKVAVFADVYRRLAEVRRVAGERERLLQAEAARAEAERASAAKDHFLAMLSHELRTPLSPILNTIELLLGGPEDPVKLREGLEMIRRNVVLEARLIDDLLDLTRVSRGKVKLQLESLDVSDCIQSALQICHPEMDEKQVTAQVDVTVESRLRADAARLKQILWNLIRNAVKFTEEGGTLRVTARDAEKAFVIITVEDGGCGISPEFLPNIFDAFRQGANPTGGLGLGLAITRALVELHGGTIEAHSEGLGSGATFTVSLPVSGPKMAESFVGQKVPETPQMKQRLPGTILLVEDHTDSRLTLQKILAMRGYVVHTAMDVGSGLEALDKEPIDVLVSDLGLPDGTGHDIMRQTSKHGRVKGIALSGFGMDVDVARSKESGFACHFTKPVEVAELDAAIQLLLAGDRSPHPDAR